MAGRRRDADAGPDSIRDKAFKFISYRSQRGAESFVQQVYAQDHGLGILYGPPLSGKTVVMRRFIDTLPTGSVAALVDGSNLDAEALLSSLLTQFHVHIPSPTTDRMLKAIEVFAVERASEAREPLLVIENISTMNAGTLHVVCQLAAMRLQGQFLFRFILVSNEFLDEMPAAPAMRAILERKTGEHELGSMTRNESGDYLYAKLRHAGIKDPQTAIPGDVFDEMYNQTAGRPGLLDRVARQYLADQAESRQVTAGDGQRAAEQEAPVVATVRAVDETPSGTVPDDAPRLIVTKDGKTIGSIAFGKSRILIGRSYDNDIAIDSDFVSRHHALLVRRKSGTTLTDLNSTNGTYVSSRRVFVCALRHDDVVSIGNHRIKLFDPSCQPRLSLKGDVADTRKMRALHDVRKMHLLERTVESEVTTGRRKS